MQLQLFDNIGEIHAPVMPIEYVGNVKKPCGYTKSAPRDWNDNEVKWVLQLKRQGWSIDEIARSVGRTPVSVSIKIKRIGKEQYDYNKDHIVQKYQHNEDFLSRINPTTILDMYAGLHSWWQTHAIGANVVTNDNNEQSDAKFHERAELLIHKLYYDGNKFDLIDLDPFGSAYDCFDCAIRMAKKAIVITYGEIGHKRFKRLDYVRRYYGIESMKDFTIDRLIKETQKIAARCKKTLTPVYICNWNRISRVYFEVGEMKITEQWN